MPEDIFVLGLDDLNHDMLRQLPESANYRFHPLLSVAELQYGDIDVARLLDSAERQLREFGDPIAAVVGYWDFPVSSMVPILCRRLGLRSAPLEAVVKCEHKYWSRLEQQKVINEHPRFGLVDLDREATLPDGMRYPVWLKPVKSFSSELAFKVADDRELADAVDQIRAGIGRIGSPFSYVLDQVELPPEIADIGGTACLAEEEISGAQLTVEGYVHGGEVHIYGVVDSVPYPDSPSFLRYQYPSQLPRRVTDRAGELSRRVVRQIGLDESAFNIEFFADPDTGRLSLLEVNPRHSQSHAPLFAAVDGVPNHQAMVRLALGRDPDLPHRAGAYQVAAKWFLRHFSDALLRRVPTAREIAELEREMDGVTIEVVANEGERLSRTRKRDSYSYELADIFVGAADEPEMIEKYQRCVDVLRFRFDE